MVLVSIVSYGISVALLQSSAGVTVLLSEQAKITDKLIKTKNNLYVKCD
jgi:hypothetical protein